MITSPEEYLSKLGEIQNANQPSQAILLPSDETLFQVDLNARTVNVPQFLSVQHEHYAETLYFKMARYFESVDLSQMTCVIQYINANGEGGIYAVPFVDIDTYKSSNEMLVPWAIGGKATKYAGTIQFTIRFYKINFTDNSFVYNLTTLPTQGEILYGFDSARDEDEEYALPAGEYERLVERIESYEQGIALFWKNV